MPELHSLDDLMRELEERENERENATGFRRFRYRIESAYFAGRRRISEAPQQIRWAYQRVTRGWDDLSMWSVRDSLPKTLGAQLVEMANISHGCPPYYPEQSGVGGPQLFLPTPGDEVHELWRGDLRRHGEALLAYSRDDEESLDVSLDLYGAAQESLRWVADNLADLWD